VTHAVLSRIVSFGIGIFGTGSGGRGPSLIAGDTVTCSNVGGGQKGLDLSQNKFVVENNLITGCRSGVYASNLKSGTVVHHNTVRLPYDGILIDQGYLDTATVKVDSNAVSGASNAGVAQSNYGRLTMTGNNIRNNLYGVYAPNPSGHVHQLHANAFVGNTSSGVYTSSDSVSATNNWWGGTGDGGACTTGADCVSLHVDTTGHLGAEPPGLPPLAPPVLAAAPRVTTLATTTAPPGAGTRPARHEHRSKPAKVTTTATPARATPIQQQIDRRSAAEARRAQRDERRAARREQLSQGHAR
jgi:hypothetical protein